MAHWGTVYLIIRHGERLENRSFLKCWWEYRLEQSVKSGGNLAVSLSKTLKYAYPLKKTSTFRKEGLCKMTIKTGNKTFLKGYGQET